jgi:N6-adenosine-specific RNA methylase IME4
MKYDIILADPPWSFKVRSPKGENRSAKNHYPVMTLDDIKRLPIGETAEDNSVLFMWAIDPMLPEALDVIKAWGFVYKTVGFYWVKENFKGNGFFTGLGYYTRANPEMCLLATRGKGLPRKNKGVRKLVFSPRGAHSVKPDEVQRRIDVLYGTDINRIELFARRWYPGWSAWGNQIERGISL